MKKDKFLTELGKLREVLYSLSEVIRFAPRDIEEEAASLLNEAYQIIDELEKRVERLEFLVKKLGETVCGY
jgi:hypothetical protein